MRLINGHNVTCKDWESFLNVLRDAKPFINSNTSIDRIASDLNITAGEIDSFLDGNGSGDITYWDFNNQPTEYQEVIIGKNSVFSEREGKFNSEWNTIFNKLDDVLGAYGYDLMSRCGALEPLTKDNPKLIAPSVFMSNHQFALEAYRLAEGLVFDFIPENLKKSRDFALDVIKYDWRAMSELIEYHERDVEILSMVLMNDRDAMDTFVPEDLKDEVWKMCVTNLKKIGVSVPDEIKRFDDLDAFQEKHGIFIGDNFKSLIVLFTIVANRSLDKDDKRPIALLIHGSDKVHSVPHRDEIELLVNCGVFRVLYYEKEVDDEVYGIIDGTLNGYDRRIHTLDFFGHGDEYSLRLGCGGEEGKIDISDFGPMTGKSHPDGDGFSELIYKAMDPNGQVILHGCSNGEGGEADDNLVNRFAQSLPCGVTIYGQMEEGALVLTGVDSNGILSTASTGKQYITHGRLGCN